MPSTRTGRAVRAVAALATAVAAACATAQPMATPDGPPRFVRASYIDVAAIGRISKFRSGVGHDYSDGAEACRSMKHYFAPRPGVDAAGIAVFAPVDGTVAELREEWAGTQVAIAAAEQPAFTVILFHVRLDPPLAVGDRVRAGQRLGTHIGDRTLSDVAVREATAGGTRLVSYVEALTDEGFAPLAARGLASRADAVIPAAERDRRPLRCDGERFLDPPGADDWAVLTD